MLLACGWDGPGLIQCCSTGPTVPRALVGTYLSMVCHPSWLLLPPSPTAKTVFAWSKTACDHGRLRGLSSSFSSFSCLCLRSSFYSPRALSMIMVLIHLLRDSSETRWAPGSRPRRNMSTRNGIEIPTLSRPTSPTRPLAYPGPLASLRTTCEGEWDFHPERLLTRRTPSLSLPVLTQAETLLPWYVLSSP